MNVLWYQDGFKKLVLLLLLLLLFPLYEGSCLVLICGVVFCVLLVWPLSRWGRELSYVIYHLCHLCLVFVMLSRLFNAALRSPAGKGLVSWLLFVMFNCVLSLSHVVSWVRCGTWLHRFLIFAAFLTLAVLPTVVLSLFAVYWNHFILDWSGCDQRMWRFLVLFTCV